MDELIQFLQSHQDTLEIIQTDLLNFRRDLATKHQSACDDSKDLCFHDNAILVNRINQQYINAMVKNIPRNIKHLSIAKPLLNLLDLSQFTSLERLEVYGFGTELTEEQLIALSKTPVKEVIGRFKNFPVTKDTIIYDNYSLNKYKDIIFASRDRAYINDIICPDFINKIEELLQFTKNYKNEDISRLNIASDRNKGISNNEIQYSRADDFSHIENLKQKYILKINEVSSIKDIIRIIKAFESVGATIEKIEICLNNRDYENIEYLKEYSNKYELEIRYGNIVRCTLQDFIKMRETLKYYVYLVSTSNLTPLEKILYAYDLVKSYQYIENEDNRTEARQIHHIVKSGSIVCVGYATMLSQLLSELGFESYSISTSVPRKDGTIGGHQRNIINVDDDVYKIHGFFAFDPTWDSAKNVVRTTTGKIVETKFLEPDDLPEKKYDNLVLYNHVLIPASDYESHFKGEKFPRFDIADHYVDKKVEITRHQNGTVYHTTHTLDFDTILRAIYNVRLAEGYSKEEAEKSIADTKEIRDYLTTPAQSKNEEAGISR